MVDVTSNDNQTRKGMKMTDTRELNQLIAKAQAKGAKVEIEWDVEAELEGRQIHSTIRVTGLKGCGPFPMAPISAAERLRELVG